MEKKIITDPGFRPPGETVKNLGEPLLVYGENGVGKTSLIKTLLGWTKAGGWDSHEAYCKPEELLVVDVEGGLSVLTKEGKLPCNIFPVNDTLDYFKERKDWLLTQKHNLKVIVIDNVTELERFITFKLATQRGWEIPEIKQWGQASNYMRKYLREFRDLKFKGIDVIFFLWDKHQNVGSAKEPDYITCPMTMSDSWKEFCGLVENYAYMGIAPIDQGTFKKGDRYLQFVSEGKIKAKKRDEKLEDYEHANLTDIYRKLRGVK